ncbi:hypothetical protein FRB95_011672 [Tulasnella sp. JGI-2019a]|nr:hypothetical protein FRB95_011672 [Tulasnella sp. JGI-2019a]
MINLNHGQNQNTERGTLLAPPWGLKIICIHLPSRLSNITLHTEPSLLAPALPKAVAPLPRSLARKLYTISLSSLYPSYSRLSHDQGVFPGQDILFIIIYSLSSSSSSLSLVDLSTSAILAERKARQRPLKRQRSIQDVHTFPRLILLFDRSQPRPLCQ